MSRVERADPGLLRASGNTPGQMQPCLCLHGTLDKDFLQLRKNAN